MAHVPYQINQDPQAHAFRIHRNKPAIGAYIYVVNHYTTFKTKKWLIAEFNAIHTYNDLIDVEEPGYDQFTFKQELRLWSKALSNVKVDRENIKDWIKEKITEAYGDDITIGKIKEIDLTQEEE